MSSSVLNYIPILTSIFSIFFFTEIFAHYSEKRKGYLLWWAIGVATFGLGTIAESINAVLGWNIINAKYWYIVGALLGGFPLAQGSVYLLCRKKFARISSIFVVSVIVIASICVILTPYQLPDNFSGELTGKIFSWKWVRYFSPFINLYAFIFLVGGAINSAYRYYKRNIRETPFVGNIFIAIGGLLPGIGGTFTRIGYVQVLYVTEFIGLLLIYAGYKIIRNGKVRVSNDPIHSLDPSTTHSSY